MIGTMVASSGKPNKARKMDIDFPAISKISGISDLAEYEKWLGMRKVKLVSLEALEDLDEIGKPSQEYEGYMGNLRYLLEGLDKVMQMVNLATRTSSKRELGFSANEIDIFAHYSARISQNMMKEIREIMPRLVNQVGLNYEGLVESSNEVKRLKSEYKLLEVEMKNMLSQKETFERQVKYYQSKRKGEDVSKIRKSLLFGDDPMDDQFGGDCEDLDEVQFSQRDMQLKLQELESKISNKMQTTTERIQDEATKKITEIRIAGKMNLESMTKERDGYETKLREKSKEFDDLLEQLRGLGISCDRNTNQLIKAGASVSLSESAESPSSMGRSPVGKTENGPETKFPSESLYRQKKVSGKTNDEKSFLEDRDAPHDSITGSTVDRQKTGATRQSTTVSDRAEAENDTTQSKLFPSESKGEKSAPSVDAKKIDGKRGSSKQKSQKKGADFEKDETPKKDDNKPLTRARQEQVRLVGVTDEGRIETVPREEKTEESDKVHETRSRMESIESEKMKSFAENRPGEVTVIKKRGSGMAHDQEHGAMAESSMTVKDMPLPAKYARDISLEGVLYEDGDQILLSRGRKDGIDEESAEFHDVRVRDEDGVKKDEEMDQLVCTTVLLRMRLRALTKVLGLLLDKESPEIIRVLFELAKKDLDSYGDHFCTNAMETLKIVENAEKCAFATGALDEKQCEEARWLLNRSTSSTKGQPPIDKYVYPILAKRIQSFQQHAASDLNATWIREVMLDIERLDQQSLTADFNDVMHQFEGRRLLKPETGLYDSLPPKSFKQVLLDENKEQCEKEDRDVAVKFEFLGFQEVSRLVRRVEDIGLRRQLNQVLKEFNRRIPSTVDVVCHYCRRKTAKKDIHQLHIPRTFSEIQPFDAHPFAGQEIFGHSEDHAMPMSRGLPSRPQTAVAKNKLSPSQAPRNAFILNDPAPKSGFVLSDLQFPRDAVNVTYSDSHQQQNSEHVLADIRRELVSIPRAQTAPSGARRARGIRQHQQPN